MLFAAPADLHLFILSGASLEVQWEPAADADQRLTYTVSAEGANVETKRATTAPGGLSVTLSSLQELTEYTVSVQAVNSGGLSRPLTAAVRMVTVGQLGTTEVHYLQCLVYLYTETVLVQIVPQATYSPFPLSITTQYV